MMPAAYEPDRRPAQIVLLAIRSPSLTDPDHTEPATRSRCRRCGTDFDNADRGQLDLLANECEGMCDL